MKKILALSVLVLFTAGSAQAGLKNFSQEQYNKVNKKCPPGGCVTAAERQKNERDQKDREEKEKKDHECRDFRARVAAEQMTYASANSEERALAVSCNVGFHTDPGTGQTGPTTGGVTGPTGQTGGVTGQTGQTGAVTGPTGGETGSDPCLVKSGNQKLICCSKFANKKTPACNSECETAKSKAEPILALVEEHEAQAEVCQAALEAAKVTYTACKEESGSQCPAIVEAKAESCSKVTDEEKASCRASCSQDSDPSWRQECWDECGGRTPDDYEFCMASAMTSCKQSYARRCSIAYQRTARQKSKCVQTHKTAAEEAEADYAKAIRSCSQSIGLSGKHKTLTKIARKKPGVPTADQSEVVQVREQVATDVIHYMKKEFKFQKTKGARKLDSKKVDARKVDPKVGNKVELK